MLTSLALIFLTGLGLGALCSRLRLPPLLGMVVTGLLLGPYALNWVDASVLAVSADLRQMALVIILTQAGLSLDLADLRRVGRPAVLMCFVPACCEMLGIVLLAPPLLGLSVLEAAVLGAVLAAVSPAVVVPRMLALMREKRGLAHSVPQLLMAGASVDDVFVIVMFTAFTSLASGGSVSAASFVQVPVSIATGIAAGALTGLLLAAFWRRVHMRDSAKVLVLLSVSFLLLAAQNALTGILPFSGLLAIMAAGAFVRRRSFARAERLALKYNKLWVAAQVLLFVLVGTAVDVRRAAQAGLAAAAVVLGALCLRMAGVALCLAGTRLSRRERIFCMLAYTPKATVQAAIGGVPLAMGLACGQTVMAVAVLSILLTAPLGAVCIDRLAPLLLDAPALDDAREMYYNKANQTEQGRNGE